MEDIEVFYALAFKYGFINRQTYLQIILKLSIEHTDSYSTFEPIACKV